MGASTHLKITSDVRVLRIRLDDTSPMPRAGPVIPDLANATPITGNTKPSVRNIEKDASPIWTSNLGSRRPSQRSQITPPPSAADAAVAQIATRSQAPSTGKTARQTSPATPIGRAHADETS